eukprot:2039293-Prymnesium_polylepis.1
MCSCSASYPETYGDGGAPAVSPRTSSMRRDSSRAAASRIGAMAACGSSRDFFAGGSAVRLSAALGSATAASGRRWMRKSDTRSAI